MTAGSTTLRGCTFWLAGFLTVVLALLPGALADVCDASNVGAENIAPGEFICKCKVYTDSGGETNPFGTYNYCYALDGPDFILKDSACGPRRTGICQPSEVCEVNGGAQSDPLITGFDSKSFHFDEVGEFTLLSSADGLKVDVTFAGAATVAKEENAWTSSVRFMAPNGDMVACALPAIQPNTSRVQVTSMPVQSPTKIVLLSAANPSMELAEMMVTAVLSEGGQVTGCQVTTPRMQATVYQVSGYEQAQLHLEEAWAAPYTWLNTDIKLTLPLPGPVTGILGATYPLDKGVEADFMHALEDSSAGRPWQPAHHEAATHNAATLLLLREAVDAAIPPTAKGSLTKQCVLRCLAERSVTQLGPGQFRVDAVPLKVLEDDVRARTAADPALRSEFAFYGKATAVLSQLSGLVSQHTVVGGSQVVLLQARRLLKHYQPEAPPVCSAPSPGEPISSCGATAPNTSGSGSSGGSGSGSDSGSDDCSSDEENSEDLVLHPRAAATDSDEEQDQQQQQEEEEQQPEEHGGVLVYQLLPEELPFKLTSCSPGALRYALRRSFAVMLGAPPTKVPTPPAAAALAHAALTAVLLASSIMRVKAAGHAVVLRLSDCSLHDALDVLLKLLLRSNNPKGNLIELQEHYGSSLSALLSEQPLCSHLVQLRQRPAPAGVAASEWHSQRALLRVDRVWPEAWVPREDLLPTLDQAPLLAAEAARGAGHTGQPHGSGEVSAPPLPQQQQQQALPPPPPLQPPVQEVSERRKATRLRQQLRRAQWKQKQKQHQGQEPRSDPPRVLAPVNGHVTLLKRPLEQASPDGQAARHAAVQVISCDGRAGEQRQPLPPLEQTAQLSVQQSEVSTPVVSQQAEAQEPQEQPPANEQVEAPGGMHLAGQRTPEQEEQQGCREKPEEHQHGEQRNQEVQQAQLQAQPQAQPQQGNELHAAPHQPHRSPAATARVPSPLELLELHGVFRQPAPAVPQPQAPAQAGPLDAGIPVHQPAAPSLLLANGLPHRPADLPTHALQQQQQQQEEEHEEKHKEKQDTGKLSAWEAAGDCQQEGREVGGPLRLPTLLLAAGRKAWALAAGVNAQLVGGFLAVHCSRGEREQAQQAAVLELLLDGGHWAEAKAFMETSISVARLAAEVAHQGSNN
ncbi:hypothetical protein N2152v2_010697 [Parachlorella kessleri]